MGQLVRTGSKIVPKERFKPVKNYPDYWVSSYGRVYSFKSEAFLKGSKASCGYKVVRLTNHKTTTLDLHRLVAEHFVSGYFKGAHVNHIDYNRLNNNVNNLEWVTQYQNNKHSEERRNHAITESKAKSYLITFPTGETEVITNLRAFCRKYNLSCGCMVHVAKGRNKQHKGFKCGYIT